MIDKFEVGSVFNFLFLQRWRRTNCLIKFSQNLKDTLSLKIFKKKNSEYFKIWAWKYIIVYVGEGDGTPLQYSCLENPMDGGAW